MKITKTKEELLAMLELGFGDFRCGLAKLVQPYHNVSPFMDHFRCEFCKKIESTEFELNETSCLKPKLTLSLEEWFFKLRKDTKRDQLVDGGVRFIEEYYYEVYEYLNGETNEETPYIYEWALIEATPQQLIVACLLALREAGNEV